MSLDIETLDGISTVENIKKVTFTSDSIKLEYESDKKHCLTFKLNEISKLMILDN